MKQVNLTPNNLNELKKAYPKLKTLEDKLAEILEEYYAQTGSVDDDDTLSEAQNLHEYKICLEEATQALTQLFLTEVLDLIGVDFPMEMAIDLESKELLAEYQHKNRLKAELRQTAQERYGGKDAVL